MAGKKCLLKAVSKLGLLYSKVSFTWADGCHESASVNSGEASGSSQPRIPDTAQFESFNGDCGLF